jgi:hypothetical protein
MAEEQHTKKVEDLKDLHQPTGGSAGGACLSRHVGDPPEQGANKSCSHRWQAYLQMEGDKGLYNWEKYKSLAEKPGRMATAAIGSFPRWYLPTLERPKAHQWDVGVTSTPIWGGAPQKNFWCKCYHPYWHEAHHMVPNSTLRNAITKFAEDAKQPELANTIRAGLLKEKYNLNEKLNMIMLPLDKEVADALRLPRHRQTAAHRNHSVYSDYVAEELKKIFSKLKQELVEHKEPKYKPLKDQIEALSKSLYKAIKNSVSPSLDEMQAIEFVQEQLF